MKYLIAIVVVTLMVVLAVADDKTQGKTTLEHVVPAQLFGEVLHPNACPDGSIVGQDKDGKLCWAGEKMGTEKVLLLVLQAVNQLREQNETCKVQNDVNLAALLQLRKGAK